MTTTVNEVDLEILVLPPTEGKRVIAREVRKLWRLYHEKERQLQLTEIELEGLQFILGEKLSGMKSLLGMYGREEQWPKFLEKSRIPRTIAEDCILEHEAGSVGLAAAATSPMLDEASRHSTIVVYRSAPEQIPEEDTMPLDSLPNNDPQT